MEVKAKAIFSTTWDWASTGVKHLGAASSNYRTSYTVGEPYKLFAPHLSRGQLFTGYSGKADDITYAMTFAHRGNASTARLDFFVGSSGETLAQPNTPGDYSGALVATDSAGATTRVHSGPPP
jgi:hypothetical protein